MASTTRQNTGALNIDRFPHLSEDMIRAVLDSYEGSVDSDSVSAQKFAKLSSAWKLWSAEVTKTTAESVLQANPEQAMDDGHSRRVSEQNDVRLFPSFREDNEDNENDNNNDNDVYFQHLHFGAGRLGMGLVVPAISDAHVSFAVVQRPKREWEDLGKFPLHVDVQVNDAVVAHDVTVLSMEQENIHSIVLHAASFSCSLGAGMVEVLTPLLLKLPRVGADGRKPVLYCCENDHAAVERLKLDLADRVYVADCMVDRVCMRRSIAADDGSADENQMEDTEAASDAVPSKTPDDSDGDGDRVPSSGVPKTGSYSTLGDYLMPYLSDIDADATGDAPQPLPAESPDRGVLPRRTSEESLGAAPSDYSTDGSSAAGSDSDAEYDQDGGSGAEHGVDGVVHVAAEPWRGSIVVLDPTLQAADTPFCSSVARVPRSPAEAEYLSERKLKLVNGMHTVLAFTTLLSRWQRGKRICADEEYVLVKYGDLARGEQRMVEAQRAVRIAQLLERFGVEPIMAWHQCNTPEEAFEELLRFSDEILLERFGRVDDLTSRVLGGGVTNRWLTRLKPSTVWMAGWSEADDERGRCLAAFFSYAAARDRYATVEAATAYPSAILQSHLKSCRRFCNMEHAITHKTSHGRGSRLLRKEGIPEVSSLRDMAAGDGPKDHLGASSYATAVQRTTLDDRYKAIAEAGAEQARAYAAWLRSGRVNAAGLVSAAQRLGLDLDISSGRLSYAAGFAPPRLCFDLAYVRHGKTEGNTEPRVFQGNVDEVTNALNEVGRGQAAEAARQLNQLELQPDLIIMSPLDRAKDTAEPYLQSNPKLREVAEVWWESHEMAFGDWDNVMVKDMEDASICHLFYLQQNAVVKSDGAYVAPDGQQIRGENFVEVLVRMRRVLDKVELLMQSLREELGRAPRVLMFGHSMAGAALQMLNGQGKTEVDGSGKEYLCFDGKYILPHATPTFLHRA